MPWLSSEVRSNLILFLLVVFLGTWTYTEVTESWERDAFSKEVNDFMHRGDSNTGTQGYALCLRVAHLEAEHHNLPTTPCEDLYKTNGE